MLRPGGPAGGRGGAVSPWVPLCKTAEQIAWFWSQHGVGSGHGLALGTLLCPQSLGVTAPKEPPSLRSVWCLAGLPLPVVGLLTQALGSSWDLPALKPHPGGPPLGPVFRASSRLPAGHIFPLMLSPSLLGAVPSSVPPPSALPQAQPGRGHPLCRRGTPGAAACPRSFTVWT